MPGGWWWALYTAIAWVILDVGLVWFIHRATFVWK